MKKLERSYGIIPIKRRGRNYYVLLVQHHAGYWAFPKGHANPDEEPQQAAERELKEETGLTIKTFLPLSPLTESYCFTLKGELIYKQVDYFAAFVTGTVVLQEEEIQNSDWILIQQAQERLTFKEGKRLAKKVEDYLASAQPKI